MKYLFGNSLLLILVSFFTVSNAQDVAVWRASLSIEKADCPFLIEVTASNGQMSEWKLINGKEQVELKNIIQKGDTVRVNIDAFDACIQAIIKGDSMSGRFVKNYIDNDPGLIFKAAQNMQARFPLEKNPVKFSMDGKWDIEFVGEKDKNVGIFQSSDGLVTGSILTPTGDLRFLEGAITSLGCQLSGFSGLSPYYLQFDLMNDSLLQGKLHTSRSVINIKGKRNPKAVLDDPYTMTRMRTGLDTLGFNMPDLNDDPVSLNSPEYKDKVVVVSILGSWCPNCLDEQKFLSQWYLENRSRGVEVIGLAFERKDDPEYAKKTISSLVKRYNIEYPIVFAGKVGVQGTQKALPELVQVMSYPTTIFINKKGRVAKIHTGFNGPATGLFYDDFQADFNSLIDLLLAE